MTDPLSFPERLSQLAIDFPHSPAVTDFDGTYTFAELWQQATTLAQHYQQAGVGFGDIVSVALPSNRTFVVASAAAWILGATPQPLSSKVAKPELQAILELSNSALVVGIDDNFGIPTLASISGLDPLSEEPLPFVTSEAWKAPVSGGSTGRPKVIVATTPAIVPSVAPLAGMVRVAEGDTLLMTAPLHHNGPFLFSTVGLMAGAHVVLMDRFDAERSLQLIQDHHVTWTYMVPTMMSRISKLPDDTRQSYDVSSLHTLFHLAAPCPVWLKRLWIEWLGPDVIWELYAGTEAQAATVINGTQWLAHEGSVGPVVIGEMKILGPEGEALPAGTIGEVWMRSTSGPTYRYMGAEAKRNAEGWESLGDLGYMDEDGFLYLCDRLADMVIVGGANVYPAEVEAVLEEHPSVIGAIVIGLPDDDMGKRLHALVNLSTPITDEELSEWCSSRLSRHKTPRSFERVDTPLRDDAAKVRRQALTSERSG
ncbi:MAG TPA: AMP-binding protein [Acidimicrobiales bacterium]